MRLNLAVVQFDIFHIQPEQNLKRAEKFAEIAKNKNANVIIFPEIFITGPLKFNKNLADRDKKYLKIFQSWATKYCLDIIPGSIIEEEAEKLYNKSYYIDKSGRILGEYKKNNLWLPERFFIEPGKEISTFHTKFGRAGLIICWDLSFPEIFRRMVKKRVKIVYCPSYWSIRKTELGTKYNKDFEGRHINGLCVARAFENNIILVYCNAVGKLMGKNNGFMVGNSQITAPFLGQIKVLDHLREEMLIQEINTDILKEAERVYKIRKDLKKL